MRVNSSLSHGNRAHTDKSIFFLENNVAKLSPICIVNQFFFNLHPIHQNHYYCNSKERKSALHYRVSSALVCCPFSHSESASFPMLFLYEFQVVIGQSEGGTGGAPPSPPSQLLSHPQWALFLLRTASLGSSISWRSSSWNFSREFL